LQKPAGRRAAAGYEIAIDDTIPIDVFCAGVNNIIPDGHKAVAVFALRFVRMQPYTMADSSDDFAGVYHSWANFIISSLLRIKSGAKPPGTTIQS